MEANIAQTLFTAAMFLIFGGFFVWALATGQFRDVEQANERLFGVDGPLDECAEAGHVSSGAPEKAGDVR